LIERFFICLVYSIMANVMTINGIPIMTYGLTGMLIGILTYSTFAPEQSANGDNGEILSTSFAIPTVASPIPALLAPPTSNMFSTDDEPKSVTDVVTDAAQSVTASVTNTAQSVSASVTDAAQSVTASVNDAAQSVTASVNDAQENGNENENEKEKEEEELGLRGGKKKKRRRTRKYKR